MGLTEKQWKLAHTKTGDPVLDEKVDLVESIQAKYLKLEINDYQAGTMNWRNVGIQEIRAYSNVPDHSKVTDIHGNRTNSSRRRTVSCLTNSTRKSQPHRK